MVSTLTYILFKAQSGLLLASKEDQHSDLHAAQKPVSYFHHQSIEGGMP